MAKKIIALGMLIIVIFAFAACGGDNEPTGTGTFEKLDSEVEFQIIKTYLGDDYSGQQSIDNNPIKGYYGTYNDCIAVSFNLGFGWGGMSFGFFTYVIFEGEIFLGKILAWKDNELYPIQEIYEQQALTKNDLKKIAALSKEFYADRYGNDDYMKRIEESESREENW